MDGMAWAASAMVAARTRLEIATQNLANVSTDGFTPVVAHGFLTAAGARVAAETQRAQGALHQTGRELDVAIVGNGGFRLRARDGRIVVTRAGAFTRGSDGTLRDAAGRTLLGRHGALRFAGDARFDQRGRVVARGRIFDALPLPTESRVESGFLEGAGVNAIGEMIDVMAAQRAFESAQKVVASIDGTRQKSAEAARIA